MYPAGTRVTLTEAVEGHPAGTPAVVVYDLDGETCQVALEDGSQLTVDCALLAPVV